MRTVGSLLLGAIVIIAGETRLGKPLAPGTPVSVSKLMRAPNASVGKVVQVKGKITEVCEKMGCWMQLIDADEGVRVKVNDGDIVFPKSSIGKTAVAEGTLKKLELTKEQAIARARHEAEERGTKFDPASVKAGATIYQIQASGAVILE